MSSADKQADSQNIFNKAEPRFRKYVLLNYMSPSRCLYNHLSSSSVLMANAIHSFNLTQPRYPQWKSSRSFSPLRSRTETAIYKAKFSTKILAFEMAWCISFILLTLYFWGVVNRPVNIWIHARSSLTEVSNACDETTEIEICVRIISSAWDIFLEFTPIRELLLILSEYRAYRDCKKAWVSFILLFPSARWKSIPLSPNLHHYCLSHL